MAVQRRIDTLDVLWAFYSSQPKTVRKAFRTRIENEDKDTVLSQWERDLHEIKALKDDWDEEGARSVGQGVIKNIERLMTMLGEGVSSAVRLYPTPLGAVMVSLDTAVGRIKGEVGDKEFSYFVKRPGMPTEYHSFLPVGKEEFGEFVDKMKSLG